MRELALSEIEMINGGDAAGVAASALAGAGAARGFAAVAGIAAGPGGAAATILVGAAIGVTLYFVTD